MFEVRLSTPDADHPASAVLDYEPAAELGLGKRTARGVTWLLGQTIISKVVGTITQILLAKLLVPSDFGTIALAYTVYTFAGLLQQVGAREILIRRKARFRQWASPAMWMSFAAGSISALATASAGPVAAIIFGIPTLTSVLALLSLAIPLNAVAIVPVAKLEADLRFRAVAALGCLVALGTAGLSLFFAARGLGALSFALPMPIIAAVRLVVAWLLARPEVRPHPQLRRWRFLLGDARWLFGVAVFTTVLTQADYAALGIFHSPREVGPYFLAYNLSTQSIQLLTASLSSALLPALSSLQHDVRRQSAAFIRAARLLAFLGIPGCYLQAVVAGPVLRILFGAKWEAAIPLLETLSIGMAFAMLGMPAASLLQAQGRFRTFFVWQAACGTSFALFVATAAALGGAFSVAISVAAFLAIFGPLGTYVAVRGGGMRWTDVAGVYLAPVVCAGTSFLLAAGAMRSISSLAQSDILQAILPAVAGSCLYLLLGVVFMRDRVHESWAQLADLLKARRR